MGQFVNCSLPGTEVTNCGKISANGCCAKGCVRNAIGRCVQEQCTGSWNGWLSRPVTMSCYFHWFLLIFAALIFALMLALLSCNVAYEVRNCMRKRSQARQSRYVHFSASSSMSSSVV
ncbi:hypothetical protein ACLKA7_010537 [Drosophila subpalustris]